MRHQKIRPRQALNKAFLKQKPERKTIEIFKAALISMLDHAKPGESEEYHKNLVSAFLKDSGFAPAHFINTKGRNDLVIHTGKDAESPVGVIIEAKRPGNAAEMPKKGDLRCKALYELLLYYLRERIGAQNIALKHLVITDLHQWYIFDAASWERSIAQDKALVKRFQEFEAGRLAVTQTDFFYKEVASPFFDGIATELPVVHFTVDTYAKILRNSDKRDDAPLIALHKVLSPQHLLKQPFANDSNSLDKAFYAELLHLIGLEEVKDKGKWLIGRKPAGRRDTASLLEGAITQLDSLDKLDRVERLHTYGDTREEQLFNVALELCITWVNRVLFLKLLEAQVVTYHGGAKDHTFLHSSRVRNYDDLNSLFFQVLARKPEERSAEMAERFGNVPYLNSSLFEPTELEHRTLFVSNLEDERPMPLHKATVLRDDRLRRLTGTLPALDYLFRFLDAYDFTSEGGEEVQEENKRLINASVLGLIFEKINGYKDGSFFTPGFITMYMCREALRPAVLRRFNTNFEAQGRPVCADFNELRDRIDSGREARAEANALINGLRICDPAVGSGHFLVSALNELIAIKSELGILSHRNGERVRHHRIAVENDELVVYDEEEGRLFEYRVGPDGRAATERQQLQETLFHEKQTLIEQCLFGVDINPNSVKICRLRLWIELLKHAYYRPGTLELETLPNIDINIKCGNSLIHRFALDADLGPALSKSKWNMTSYRLAVQTYRHAQDKAQKREMERLIDSIKGDFQAGISQETKAVRDLNKVKNEYYLAYEKEQLFDSEGKPRLTRKQVEHRRQLEEKINKLSQVVEDLKNNVLFTNAFEWRFEFPEVLDDKGRFTGFDVVIGNPPYIGLEAFDKAMRDAFRQRFKMFERKFETSVLFMVLGLDLLRPSGLLAYIAPVTWQTGENYAAFREYLFTRKGVDTVLNLPFDVFEGAYVDTGVYIIANEERSTYRIFSFDKKARIDDLQDVPYASVDASTALPPDYKVLLDPVVGSILRRCIDAHRFVTLGHLTRSTQGLSGSAFPRASSDAQFVMPYLAKYGRGRYWLEEIEVYPTDMSSHRNLVPFYEAAPKVLIRRIIGRDDRLSVSYLDRAMVMKKDLNPFIPKDERVHAKYLAGLLGSRLLSFLYLNSSSIATKDDFRQTTLSELRRLPVPLIPTEEQQPIIDAVSGIIDHLRTHAETDVSDLERVIDTLVYRLYGLTEEEIAMVEAAVVRG